VTPVTNRPGLGEDDVSMFESAPRRSFLVSVIWGLYRRRSFEPCQCQSAWVVGLEDRRDNKLEIH
jgi:hypothetical protein